MATLGTNRGTDIPNIDATTVAVLPDDIPELVLYKSACVIPPAPVTVPVNA